MKNTSTEKKSVSRPVRQSYSHAKADARKDRRRLEAMVRQDRYNGLTLEQKIAKAIKRGGSNRELTRLMSQVKAETKKIVEKKETQPSAPISVPATETPKKKAVKKKTAKKKAAKKTTKKPSTTES